jgi:hypothetical protein
MQSTDHLDFDFFPQFESDGNLYHIGHGTLRNKFLMLKQQGKIEVDYKSKQSFYTLKGIKFKRNRYGINNTMTPNRMVVPSLSLPSSLSLSNFIDTLPPDRYAVHDIRFKFRLEDIWSNLIRRHPELTPNEVSKDIALDRLIIDDLTIKVTVHHTDTVSVIVACTLRPVAVDTNDLKRLSDALTRVEERLFAFIEDRPPSLSSLNPIPNHKSWKVTMWHFGIDSPQEYAGDKFEITWEDGSTALARIYTKNFKDGNGIRIRRERQEYPNKRFDVAIDEKLGTSG